MRNVLKVNSFIQEQIRMFEISPLDHYHTQNVLGNQSELRSLYWRIGHGFYHEYPSG